MSTRIPKSLIVTLKKEYLESGKSVREIAEKYQVSIKSLEQRAWRENWRIKEDQIVEKIVEKVEERENLKTDLLKKHQEEMLLRMRKRLNLVDKSFEQIGELVEPQDLKSLVSTEAQIDMVCRRSLGASESVDVTSQGQSINIVNILMQVRALQKPEDMSRVVNVEYLKECSKNLTK